MEPDLLVDTLAHIPAEASSTTLREKLSAVNADAVLHTVGDTVTSTQIKILSP